MSDINFRFEPLRGRTRATLAALVLVVFLAADSALVSRAQQLHQRTFSSASAGCRTLFLAIQNKDEQAVAEILGAGKELVCSDDASQDERDREQFIDKYQQMHRLVREPDGTTVLTIGAENWPFPVPLVSSRGVWRFDARAGMQEVLSRRIGENEEAAIQICHELVRAAKLKSASEIVPTLFYGYHFRILTSQGNPPSARSGVARSNGQRTRRFAIVAYPAQYRSSGVLTFLVSQEDALFARDLGPNTVKRAKSLSRYRPDSTWHAVL